MRTQPRSWSRTNFQSIYMLISNGKAFHELEIPLDEASPLDLLRSNFNTINTFSSPRFPCPYPARCITIFLKFSTLSSPFPLPSAELALRCPIAHCLRHTRAAFTHLHNLPLVLTQLLLFPPPTSYLLLLCFIVIPINTRQCLRIPFELIIARIRINNSCAVV